VDPLIAGLVPIDALMVVLPTAVPDAFPAPLMDATAPVVDAQVTCPEQIPE
jgi:hypothetical protein